MWIYLHQSLCFHILIGENQLLFNGKKDCSSNPLGDPLAHHYIFFPVWKTMPNAPGFKRFSRLSLWDADRSHLVTISKGCLPFSSKAKWAQPWIYIYIYINYTNCCISAELPVQTISFLVSINSSNFWGVFVVWVNHNMFSKLQMSSAAKKNGFLPSQLHHTFCQERNGLGFFIFGGKFSNDSSSFQALLYLHVPPIKHHRNRWREL